MDNWNAVKMFGGKPTSRYKLFFFGKTCMLKDMLNFQSNIPKRESF